VSAPGMAVRGAGAVTRGVVGWWRTPVPLARVALLRLAIYGFVLVDMQLFVNDVVPHGYAPEFYRPLWVGRVLPLPTPTPTLVQTLYWLLIVGCVVAASGRLPRLAGWVVAVAFFEWLIVGMSYGKVDHDHLALLVAVWVLPTVGRAGFRDATPSEAAGWALRCIQLAVALTYFLSAVTKSIRSGWPWGWANGAVFVWAISRRGSDLARQLLDTPELLRLSQWGVILAELVSPVILFLRGRLLALAAGFFLSFHLVTYLAIGIHFLPTVVCWLAFAPLERLVGIGGRHSRRTAAPASGAAAPGPEPDPGPDPALDTEPDRDRDREPTPTEPALMPGSSRRMPGASP
jgi:hypothetical protein